ncbi:MAG TPA: hypothetical protein VIB79_14070 [Candidatus Binatia bacterium]
MQYKIFVFLTIVTLALGTLLFLVFRDDPLALLRFRWFLSNNPMRNLSEAAPAFAANPGSLGYGALALFAMVVVGLLIRFITNAELQALRDRVIAAEVRKAELETLLQDALWKERQARVSKESAQKTLEARFISMVETQDRLAEAEKLLRTREKELNALRTNVNVTASAQPQLLSAQQTGLAEELREKTLLLQDKESAIRQLEERLIAAGDALQAERAQKEQSERKHDEETGNLRARLAEIAADQERAENSFTAELASKQSEMKQLETSLNAKISALDANLNHAQELLRSRSTELQAARSEAAMFKGQMADLISAKEQIETAAAKDLKDKTEELQARGTALREIQESTREKIHGLELRLAAKERLEHERDQEIADLKGRIANTAVATSQTETLLAAELRKEKEQSASREARIQDLEGTFAQKIHALERQLSDRNALLERANRELDAVKAEMTQRERRLADSVSSRQEMEKTLKEELAKAAELLKSERVAFEKREAANTSTIRNLEEVGHQKSAVLEENKAKHDSLVIELKKVAATRDLLQEQLSKAVEERSAQQATIDALEEKFRRTLDPLKTQINEQQRLLASREQDLRSFKAKTDALNAQLLAMRASEEAASKQPAEERRSESDLETKKRLHALELALEEKEDLLKSDQQKIERLEAELKEKRTTLAKYEIGAWQAYERRVAWKERLRKVGISIKDREL